jgi:hypothetical protein
MCKRQEESGSPSHLGIAGLIISNGPFLHAQRNVSVHITEGFSPNVRMILFHDSVYNMTGFGWYISSTRLEMGQNPQ